MDTVSTSTTDAWGIPQKHSLSKNALSEANTTLSADTWSTVAVAVNASTGGTFFLNGEAIGSFDATQAEIPAGDFGSNDCYDAGLACENLMIGRHGAGADRYHFEGMIDHVSISSDDHRITTDDGGIGLDGSDDRSPPGRLVKARRPHHGQRREERHPWAQLG